MPKEKMLLTQDQEKYLAWLLLPEIERQPKAKHEFAATIGVVYNTLLYWEKKKAFIERWRLGVEGLAQSPDRTRALLDAIYQKGLDGDTKSAELYLKATGTLTNSQSLTIKNEQSIKDVSDDELENMILELASKKNIKNDIGDIQMTATIVSLVEDK